MNYFPLDNSFLENYKKLHELCLKQQVGHSLNYNEGSNTWYISINSPSPAEELVTKDYSLETVLELAIEHMLKLQSK